MWKFWWFIYLCWCIYLEIIIYLDISLPTNIQSVDPLWTVKSALKNVEIAYRNLKILDFNQILSNRYNQ